MESTLDLSAAFDIVDHPLFLEKLNLYGFSDDALNWVRSYLTGRSQRVYIESFLSTIVNQFQQVFLKDQYLAHCSILFLDA